MIKDLLIAGPCAAESPSQIDITLTEAGKRPVSFVRVSLWKPRTKPGFDGIGAEDGLPLLQEAARRGLNPATEVLTPKQAQAVLEAVLPVLGDGKLCIWIGSRNQNHFIQQEISELASQDDRVTLLVKNQPWESEDHWRGLIDHVLHGGIPRERLLLCHRGFTPNGVHPYNYRNVPHYEMAMRVKAATGARMVFDPSHTGGTVDNVKRVAREAAAYDFDGMIVEVHPSPAEALSDAKQQLTWEEFDQLLASM
ncbi:hypothetical protein KGQ71_00200 [Patescibacteria group bacterium]|nr:hypothetical protein [Patescibacteria group bacterium]